MLVVRLSKIPLSVRVTLARSGILTTSALRHRIGDQLSSGLKKVADQTGCEEEDIIAVLLAELVCKPAIGWSVVRDSIVALAALGLATLLVAAIDRTTPPKRHPVARTSLPALHLVTEDDLKLEATETTGLEAIADAAGRRLLLPIAEGESLSESHLTPLGVAPQDLEGMALLQLRLEDGASEIEASVGFPVTLLFSPRVLAGQGGLEVEALVLALESSDGENTTTVAVASDVVSPIARFLATSDISIVRRCCPEPETDSAGREDSR